MVDQLAQTASTGKDVVTACLTKGMSVRELLMTPDGGAIMMQTVELIATSYFGADPKANNSVVYEMAVAALQQNFPSWTKPQIIFAFNEWAAGNVDADEAAYRGQFTVPNLTRVLKAFADKRGKVMVAADRLLSESSPLSEVEIEARNASAQRDQVRFWNAVLTAQQNPELAMFPDWETFTGNAPLAVTCAAGARRWIEAARWEFPNEDKQRLWAESKRRLIDRLIVRKSTAMHKFDREEAAKLLENMAGPDFTGHRMVLYAQMLIWELHLNPILYAEI
jgi:hypothetical protein